MYLWLTNFNLHVTIIRYEKKMSEEAYMISLYTLIVIISSFSLLITIVGMYDNYFMPEFKQKSFRILFAMLIAQNWFEWLG